MANEERRVGPLTHVDTAASTATVQETVHVITIRDTVPVCIKLCEPICAESKYEIGIEIFDRPVGKITVGGLTRFFNCRDK